MWGAGPDEERVRTGLEPQAISAQAATWGQPHEGVILGTSRVFLGEEVPPPDLTSGFLEQH